MGTVLEGLRWWGELVQMAEVSQRRGWLRTGSRALANPRFDGVESGIPWHLLGFQGHQGGWSEPETVTVMLGSWGNFRY